MTKIIVILTRRLGLPVSELKKGFQNGQYKGTWVHRDLALELADYCDDSCELAAAVSQAIRALADRPPVPAPAAAAPLSEQEKALGILHVAEAEAQAIAIKAAAEEKALAVKAAGEQKVLTVQERQLAVASKYSELERSHLKNIGNIKVINTERQAAAKRKQQEETAAQAKKHAKMEAETQAAKDKQNQLRRQTAQQPSATRLSLVPHRNAASNLRTGLTPMSGTFVMDEAVHKAAKDMGVAYHLVIKFMRDRSGNKTGYQKLLEQAHVVKTGNDVIKVNKKHGHYHVGAYPKSKFEAAVNWIKKYYKDVTPRVQLRPAIPPRH